jgi:hypothetical protein
MAPAGGGLACYRRVKGPGGYRAAPRPDANLHVMAELLSWLQCDAVTFLNVSPAR